MCKKLHFENKTIHIEDNLLFLKYIIFVKLFLCTRI